MVKKTNYCTFSPDTIGKVYIGDLCSWHDTHYKLDMKLYERKRVDQLFRESVKNRLTKGWKWTAYLYYFAVRVFCGPSWQRWKYRWFLGFIPIRRFNV